MSVHFVDKVCTMGMKTFSQAPLNAISIKGASVH